VTVSGGSKSYSHAATGADTGLHLVRGGQFGNGAAAMPFQPAHYVLDSPLPDLGDHAAAYRLDAPSIDVATMQHYAQVLGLKGPVQGEVAHGMSVADGDAHLVVFNGAQPLFSYTTGIVSSGGGVVSGVIGVPGNTSSTTSTSTTTPVATRDAEKIATDTLQSLGVVADFHDWKVTANDTAVTFTQLVDGVPVTGDQWSVDVANDGSIASVEGTRGTPAKIADVPLRPIADVWQDVVNGTYISPGPRPLALGAPITVVPLPAQPTPPSGPASFDVHITGATLGLALWPTADSTTDLVPTYRFAERDGSDIEALAVTNAEFGTPPAVTTTTLGSIGTLPTISALPPTASGGVTVIATMHVVPGTAPSPTDVRIELTNSLGGAQPNATMTLPERDGYTTTAQIPLGKYFVNSFAPGTTSAATHAESQFTAQNGETVHLDLHYGGTISTITATVTPPSK
jgi:hypothetical protein